MARGTVRLREVVVYSGQTVRRDIDHARGVALGRLVEAQPRRCYANALRAGRLLRDDPAVHYCEGWAISVGVPFQHAWLLVGGTVVDPTWSCSPPLGSVYVPVISCPPAVAAPLRRHLDPHRRRWFRHLAEILPDARMAQLVAMETAVAWANGMSAWASPSSARGRGLAGGAGGRAACVCGGEGRGGG